ncbi:hypothetical protein AYI70_g2967 [Smittium culicis]|uniref:Uncharacterized protein n=1 Tax=Smittium culicis TaxID=133412 RepID=A0A1R1Y5Y4_9FUNG|nr:hypothetical protein AYI70_g9204 [Smittium culicis]OMJ22303.1 hypothetical protein AYI70_g2967 [Smittium culicis]
MQRSSTKKIQSKDAEAKLSQEASEERWTLKSNINNSNSSTLTKPGQKKKLVTVSTNSYINLVPTIKPSEKKKLKSKGEDLQINELQVGRKSFKSFNADIEKIQTETLENKKEEISKKKLEKITISDKEMAAAYSNKRVKR